MAYEQLEKQEQQTSFHPKPRQIKMAPQAYSQPQSPVVNHYRRIGNMAVQRIVGSNNQLQEDHSNGVKNVSSSVEPHWQKKSKSKTPSSTIQAVFAYKETRLSDNSTLKKLIDYAKENYKDYEAETKVKIILNDKILNIGEFGNTDPKPFQSADYQKLTAASPLLVNIALDLLQHKNEVQKVSFFEACLYTMDHELGLHLSQYMKILYDRNYINTAKHEVGHKGMYDETTNAFKLYYTAIYKRLMQIDNDKQLDVTQYKNHAIADIEHGMINRTEKEIANGQDRLSTQNQYLISIKVIKLWFSDKPRAGQTAEEEIEKLKELIILNRNKQKNYAKPEQGQPLILPVDKINIGKEWHPKSTKDKYQNTIPNPFKNLGTHIIKDDPLRYDKLNNPQKLSENMKKATVINPLQQEIPRLRIVNNLFPKSPITKEQDVYNVLEKKYELQNIKDFETIIVHLINQGVTEAYQLYRSSGAYYHSFIKTIV